MQSRNANRRIRKLSKATFAGGCFWCVEEAFSKARGVVSVFPGYTGGKTKNPSYDDVCQGDTGHYEAVLVIFDVNSTSYEKLLEIFWSIIDPSDSDGQFADRGEQYRTAIFYHTESQRISAENSKKKIEKAGVAVSTAIIKAKTFYKAEEYHRKYFEKNACSYNNYKALSGRK